MYILSIHREGLFFKAALLAASGRSMTIESLQEGLVENFDLQELLKSLPNERIEIVSALRPDQMIVRTVLLPVKKIGQAKKAIGYQLEDLFPFPLEGASILKDYQKTENAVEVTLTGYQHKALCQHIQSMKALGVDPDTTTAVSAALRRFAEVFAQEEKPFILFHLGWEDAFFLCIKKNKVKKSVSIAFGLRQIIDLLPDAENDISVERLEQMLSDTKTELSLQIQAFQKKVQRIEEFFLEKEEEKGLFRVFYTGNDEIGRFLCRDIFAEEKRIQMVPHIQFRNEHLLNYAIEVGMCLDVIEQDKHSLQLLTGLFTPERKRREETQNLKKFVAGIVGCSFILFLSFQCASYCQHNHLQNKVQTIATQTQENISQYRQLSSLSSVSGVKRDLVRLLKHQKKAEADCIVPFLASECLQWIAQSSSGVQHFTHVDLETSSEGKQAKLFISFIANNKEGALQFQQELIKHAPYMIEENLGCTPLQREKEYGLALVISQ